LVEVTKGGNHDAPLSILCENMMCKTAGFTCGTIFAESEDRALAYEVHRCVVIVQISKYWRKFLPQMYFLCGCGILRIHVDDQVSIGGKK
jgi:hypothetical protein